MSAKVPSPGLLKIKVFWNKGYDVIISVYDVTYKILSLDDVAIWPKFGNASISETSYHNLSFIRIWQEK